jgi:hypothetical protein
MDALAKRKSHRSWVAQSGILIGQNKATRLGWLGSDADGQKMGRPFRRIDFKGVYGGLGLFKKAAAQTQSQRLRAKGQ